MKYAFAAPILPGKTEAAREFIRTVLGPRSAEWADFQQRQGVVQETYFLQESPDGDMIIVSGEGDWIPPSEFIDPDNPFDQWFVEQVREINGFDVREFGAKPPDVLGEWQAPVPAA